MAKNVQCISGDRYHINRRHLIRTIQNTLLEIPEVRKNISEREVRWLPLEDTLRTFLKLKDMDSYMDSVQNFMEQLKKHPSTINSPLRKWIRTNVWIQPNALNDVENPTFITTTLFLEFIKKGPLEVVDLLLKAGADPLIPDGDGNTALMLAADGSHTSIVKRLLEIPAVKDHINAVNKQGKSAITNATEKGSQEIVGLLHDAGASSDSSQGKKTEQKKSPPTKKDDAATNTTGKKQEQNPLLRETAEAEKKASLPGDSFWERAFSGLKKFLY